ncbi:MAG: hypothetical protein HZA59_02445 [Hydrogenophilales bacterium]|nr:hypothetical protein [Hydrogenophilales bacterium]
MPQRMIQLKDEEITMLREEMEMLMSERQMLLRIAGAAAAFVAELDTKSLPANTYEAAEFLAEFLNELSEESLRDSLEAVKAHMIGEVAA